MALKGGKPVSSSYKIVPKDQMSALKSYYSPESTSGALYRGVPQMVAVTDISVKFLERPRSAILMIALQFSLLSNRFSNFRSRCTIFMSFIFLIPQAS